MANEANVKFKKGLQSAYDAAKEAGTLIENALYFTIDTHRLFLGEDEISTPIRVTGIDDGTNDWNFPSAYADDSYATVTQEPSTGEIRLGSAATMNVIKQFGPGDYYQPWANGNRFVPSAAAVWTLLQDMGGLTVGIDQHFSYEPNWADFSDRLQKNKIHRYLGPSSTIPSDYTATPGYSSADYAETAEINYGDYFIVVEVTQDIYDEETDTTTSVKRKKFLVIHQSSSSDVPLFSFVHPDNMTDAERHSGIVPAPGTGDRDSVLTGSGKWVHPTESLMGETVDWYLEPDNIIPTDGTTPQVDDTATEYGSRYIKTNVSGGVIEYYGTMFLTVDKDYIYTPVDENDTNTLYLRVRLQNKAYDQENPSAAPYYIYKTVKLLNNGDGITTLPKGTWIFKTGSRGWLYAELIGEFPTDSNKVTTLDKTYTNGNRGLNIQLKEDDAVASTVEVPVMVGTPSHGGGQGKTGLVPAPSYGDNTRFLRGDGVWSLPTLLPYGISGSSKSDVYYGDTVQNVTVIEINSEENLLANQYFVATFTDNYYLNDGDEKITFLNKSTNTSVPILPRYRGDNIRFLPRGTWMWVKVDGNQTYELIGTFGPEWEQANNG